MRTSFDLDDYLFRHPVSQAACAFIREAAADVSRNVGGTPFPSVITEFQSDKMAVSVNTESHTGELPFAIHLELDNSVEAFFEQAPLVDCIRTDCRGRKACRAYRADFVVLHKNGPYIVQVKNSIDVREMLEKYKSDWVERDGTVVDLPAERAFESIGLSHRVVLNTDFPKIRVANLRTLLRVRAVVPEPSSDITERVANLLNARSVVRMAELIEDLQLTSAAPVLKLILERAIYVDIDRQLITKPDSCLISNEMRVLKEVLKAKNAFGFSPPSTPISSDRAPSLDCAKKTLAKLDALRQDTTTRNVRRWKKAIKDNSAITPFCALLPKHHLRGNRLPKRPTVVLEFATKSLEIYWANTKRPTITTAHSLYEVEAKSKHEGLKPVSRPTYQRMAEALKPELIQNRGGIRQKNAHASPSDVNTRAIRATRPFEHAQVDHCLTKAYCELYRAGGRTYAARPWLTVLRDTYQGEPLARWISFSKPSRHTVGMVIRSCLRRHGRLPETISTDKGGEFLSVYLSSLAAHYGFHLEIRPSSNSRFGGSIERFFALFRSRWLDGRPGNITDIKQIRAISSSHHPRNLPCLRLPDYIREFDAFCHWYIHEAPKSTGSSPFHLRQEGLDLFPFSGLIIPYDEAFVIATAVDYGELSIDKARGIKIKDEHYWHSELKRFADKGNVPVRTEWEDHTCIYVKLGSAWVTARSSRHFELAAVSEECRLAESLIVMDAKEQRDLALQDSKEALVRVIHEADARFAQSEGTLSAAAEPLTVITQNDIWNIAREAAVSGLSITDWRQ